jgi:hypothetical protein
MNQGNVSSSQNFPLDNLVYDLMMIITEKSKGLEAMDKYLQDAQNNQRVKDSLQKIRQQDVECVRDLTQHLSYLIGQQASGQAGAAAGQRPGQGTTGGSSNR